MIKYLENFPKCNYFIITSIIFKMEIQVINIGNSKGIRLSKAILEQYKINDKLELILEKSRIILKPKSVPREGWEKLFKQMHENKDDQLLIDDVFKDENFEEWKSNNTK